MARESGGLLPIRARPAGRADCGGDTAVDSADSTGVLGAPESPLPFGGLVVVSGHIDSGDRTGPNWSSIYGGSLHLRSVNRLVCDDRLGSRRSQQTVAEEGYTTDSLRRRSPGRLPDPGAFPGADLEG